jgi:hypothetical protein
MGGKECLRFESTMERLTRICCQPRGVCGSCCGLLLSEPLDQPQPCRQPFIRIHLVESFNWTNNSINIESQNQASIIESELPI